MRGGIRPGLLEARLSSIGAEGDTFAIGSSLTSTAHIFTRDGADWAETQTLEPVDSDGNAQFGRALALADDVLAVGSPRDQGVFAGAVYIYERGQRGTWDLAAKFDGDDLDADSTLGLKVATDGALVLASAGSTLHVFARNRDAGWTPAASFQPLGPNESYGQFALSGGQILVGVPNHDAALHDQGAVYVFERDGDGVWQQIDTLVHPTPWPEEGFGAALHARGAYLFVSTLGVEPYRPASVHLYERGAAAWTYAGCVGEGPAVDGFGSALAALDDTAFLGAPTQDAGDLDDAGSVGVYAYSSDSDGDGRLDACYLEGDLNGDRIVDDADVQLVLEDYGRTCPTGKCELVYVSPPFNATEGYGFDVAVLGDTIAVHERGASSRHQHNMRVHLFHPASGAWAYEQTFGTYWWGFRMAAGKSLIAVGGIDGDVYALERQADGWSETQVAFADYDELYWLVGAAESAIASFYGESARIFERDDLGEWAQTQTLDLGIGFDWDSVSAGEGDILAVVSAATLVIMERGVDEQWAVTYAANPGWGALADVAVDAGRIIVGAPYDDTNPPNIGAAYILEKQRGDWTQTRRFELPGNTANLRFGHSVDLFDDLALVSAPYAQPVGEAHLFAVGAGELLASYAPAYRPDLQYFGFSVALTGQTAAIGAVDAWDFSEGGRGDVFGLGIPSDDDGNYDPALCDCFGDADGDADVDQSDLGVVLANFGRELE